MDVERALGPPISVKAGYVTDLSSVSSELETVVDEKRNPKVDGFIRKNQKWELQLQKLREVVLKTALVEDVKWRVPCYTFEGRNVVFLGAFKEACALSFVNGALLKDEKGILKKPGEQTQAGRVIRFVSVEEIVDLAPVLIAYIEEAVAVEKAGLKVQRKDITEREVPEELQARLKSNKSLRTAFAALTPGRQRAYLLFFAGAKQAKTRESRIDKHVARIISGKGLDDD